MAELKVTLKRSIIGRPQNQKDTVKALGLTKINSSVIKSDSASVLGMIRTVAHLVDVEEVK